MADESQLGGNVEVKLCDHKMFDEILRVGGRERNWLAEQLSELDLSMSIISRSASSSFGCLVKSTILVKSGVEKLLCLLASKPIFRFSERDFVIVKMLRFLEQGATVSLFPSFWTWSAFDWDVTVSVVLLLRPNTFNKFQADLLVFAAYTAMSAFAFWVSRLRGGNGGGVSEFSLLIKMNSVKTFVGDGW